MSAICGCVSSVDCELGATSIDKMIDRLNHWQADRTNKWQNGKVSLGNLLLFTTPESLNETLPFSDKGSELTITAAARIDNRKELLLLLA